MDAAAARHVGARLLGEVEEESLEELLTSLRSDLLTTDHRNPEIPFPELTSIIGRYQRATQSAPPPLCSVSGRYLPFLYHLVSTLIAAPNNYVVVIIDTEAKFDVTRLLGNNSESSTTHPATIPDLKHVHIYQPGRGQDQVQRILARLPQFMFYGRHESLAREWWGTIVIGGIGGDVNAGWKGWLKVERESVSGFAPGVSVEEALRDREKRQRAVEGAGWAAGSRWGGFAWEEG
ncbi:hypothetical protein F5Y16DRAFT_240058 [Xylariaceae sp. FL0255]|nr:hypothetical protein F5Y16DRAFT_240058 [Xylariaceae sp. FL0255]